MRFRTLLSVFVLLPTTMVAAQDAASKKRADAVAEFVEAGKHPQVKGSMTFLRWKGDVGGSLSYMYLSSDRVNDAVFEKVALFPEITAVHLCESRVSDAGLATVEKLPNLEQLSLLPINRFTKAGVKIVQWSYPTMPQTDEKAPITNKGLKLLKSCPKLKTLDLVDTRVTAAGLNELRGLPKLQSLSIGFALDESAVAALKQLPKLSHLGLHGPAASKQSIQALVALPAVRSLEIFDTPLESGVVAAIGELTHLEELSLPDCGLRDTDLAPLGKLVGLTTLRIGRNPIVGPGLASLQTCSKLKTLVLDYTDLSDRTVKHLASIPALEDLWLNHNIQITNSALSTGGLKDIATLKQLRLRGIPGVDDGAYETFVGMSQLKGLVVRGTPFSLAAVEKLKKSRPDLSVLK